MAGTVCAYGLHSPCVSHQPIITERSPQGQGPRRTLQLSHHKRLTFDERPRLQSHIDSSSSPKLSARCADILQVRRCNRLEMPDKLNTFVLKTYGCLRPFSRRREMPVHVDQEPLPSPADSSVPAIHSRGSTETGNPGAVTFALPGLYHKTDHFLCPYPWFHGHIPRMKAAHMVQSSGMEGHGVFLVRQSETRKGSTCSPSTTGAKPSTVNRHNLAWWHLRLSLTELGQCRVQHLHFPSVMAMLSHFRLQPIPLECGAACDVKLSSFVVAGCRPAGQGQVSSVVLVPFSLHRWSSEPSLAHCSLARSPSLPPTLPSSTAATPAAATTVPPHHNNSSHPGAVPQSGQPPGLPLRSSNPRTAPPMAAPPGPLRRSESVGRRPLLRHPHPHHPPLFPQRDSDYELEPERGRKRAIDNQYMFV
ncbi:hypothetical protein CRUP_025563 [Coryphaenoides rupestris]|nr:hypothetical protein CRUP_025563 [Coryphaenoides rupestris]